MTPYLTCDAAVDLLEAFIDGELRMEQQVAVESHLRWCRVCEARVTDMQLIGGSLQLVAHAIPTGADARDLAALQSGVLARVRAERDQSVATQIRNSFADMRLFWPALGATAAVVTCLYAATGMLAAATAEENSQSMAAMIEMLAHPGSDNNPMGLDGLQSAPRALDASLVLDSVKEEDDAAYAVSAVVTREGRVSNYELVLSERDSVRRLHTAASTDREAIALLDAVRRSRFEPAQTRRGGGPVAVNVVLLVARTTVKGSARVELALPQTIVVRVPTRSELQKPVNAPAAPRPAPPSPTA